MDARAVYELVKCVIIEFLDEMAEEDFVLVHGAIIAGLEVIHLDVKELIGLFAGTVHILTLSDVQVDDTYHGHPLSLIAVSSS